MIKSYLKKNGININKEAFCSICYPFGMEYKNEMGQ